MGWPSELSITFLSPWWLALLALLPFIVYQSVGSLSGLGPVRRAVAIGLRCIVLSLLIAALADLQWVRKTDQFCTFFVLDYSQSIPNEADEKSGERNSKAERALKIVSDAITGRKNLQDQAGLIVFGKEARIELPPARYPDRKSGFSIRQLTSSIDRQHSNLAAGLKMALGSFPPDSAKRIVLISDGNQNIGNALAQALAAQKNADGKIPIDVVPIEYRYDSEILVDKVVLPPELKKGDTANLKIALRSAKAASGVLKLVRISESGRKPVLEKRVKLEEGLTVLSVKQTIDAPDTYTFEAEFVPDPDSGDRLARNNRRTGITSVRGKGRVLVIEPSDGEFGDLAAVLREDGLEVVSMRPESLKEALTQFRSFDAVIVGNIPAERLGEPLQELLVANCRDLGAGLMMVGGPESFGAGGYKNSPIEKALPVDMEIKSTKVRGKGALVLIMHACEIPEGNRWEKDMAILALDKLGPEDECGVLEFGGVSGTMNWVFNLQRVGDGRALKRLVNRMQPSDMPDFDPGMQKALTSLTRSDAMNKHVIIMSDGDPQPPTNQTLQQFVNAKITCTTVAIAAHGGTEKGKMGRIARATKGRFHDATNPKTLPQIYMHETRLISRPLIFEKEPPWAPRIDSMTEPIAGLVGPLPAIRGLVLTTPKERADVPIKSPYPAELEVVPLVAHWQFNLGRSVAVTTDAGRKWAAGWSKTQMYKKFWSQLVRWMLRPAADENLSLSMQEKDGEVTVVVNAIDKANEFVNFLKMKGSLIQPVDANGKVPTTPVDFRQSAPGKYEAKFRAENAGSYFLSVSAAGADGKSTFLSTGLDVSYPPEYRDLESNRDLLENIASITDGRVITLDEASKTDFFKRERGPAFRLQDAWPGLLLAAVCLFVLDVGVRRIAIEPAAIAAFASRQWTALRSKKQAAASPTMERLKSVKASVEDQLRQRRFEVDPNAPPAGDSITASSSPAPARSAPLKPPPSLAPDAEKPTQETSFSRLLKAKQDALKKRNEPKE